MIQVVAFYQPPGTPFADNRDPLIPAPIPPQQQSALVNFLAGGLTDPRVAAETAPFDRPTLMPETGAGAALLAGTALVFALRRTRNQASSISSQSGFGGSVAGNTQRISA